MLSDLGSPWYCQACRVSFLFLSKEFSLNVSRSILQPKVKMQSWWEIFFYGSVHLT